MQHYPDVDTYIASYPAATQRLLEQMRATIRKAAPQAEESITNRPSTSKICGHSHIAPIQTGARSALERCSATPW